MSMKVYEGYRLPKMSAFELNQFLRGFRSRFRPVLKKMLLEKQVKLILQIIDRETLGLKVHEKLCEKASWARNPLSLSLEIIRLNHEKIYTTNIRNPSYDFGCEIVLFPTGEFTLARIKTEKEEFTELWEREELVEEYPYWDNTDRPKDISSIEWRQRRDEWNSVTSMDNCCFRVEMTNDIRLPYAEVQDILHAIPSLQARAMKRAKEHLLDTKADEIYNELGKGNHIFEAVKGAAKWLEENPEVLEATIADFENRLIPEITEEVLRKELPEKEPVQAVEGWLDTPKETGHYWISSKRKPGTEIGFFFAHDDSLDIIQGSARGGNNPYRYFFIGIESFLNAHPEAKFMPMNRPDNIYRKEADHTLRC